MSRYNYPILAIEVVDGDTLWVYVDHGYRLTQWIKIRPPGIDCPEKSVPAQRQAALASEAASRDWVSRQAIGKLRFHSVKHYPDKYGRMVGDVVRADGESWGSYMLSTGFAVEAADGKRHKWTDKELDAIEQRTYDVGGD